MYRNHHTGNHQEIEGLCEFELESSKYETHERTTDENKENSGNTDNQTVHKIPQEGQFEHLFVVSKIDVFWEHPYVLHVFRHILEAVGKKEYQRKSRDDHHNNAEKIHKCIENLI
jgi:hypothetical protein